MFLAHQTARRTKWVGGIKRTGEGEVDYVEDFFNKPAFLTVSGQLQARPLLASLTPRFIYTPSLSPAF